MGKNHHHKDSSRNKRINWDVEAEMSRRMCDRTNDLDIADYNGSHVNINPRHIYI